MHGRENKKERPDRTGPREIGRFAGARRDGKIDRRPRVVYVYDEGSGEGNDERGGGGEPNDERRRLRRGGGSKGLTRFLGEHALRSRDVLIDGSSGSRPRVSIYHARFRAGSASGRSDGDGVAGTRTRLGGDALRFDRSTAAAFCRPLRTRVSYGLCDFSAPRKSSSDQFGVKARRDVVFTFWTCADGIATAPTT